VDPLTRDAESFQNRPVRQRLPASDGGGIAPFRRLAHTAQIVARVERSRMLRERRHRAA